MIYWEYLSSGESCDIIQTSIKIGSIPDYRYLPVSQTRQYFRYQTPIRTPTSCQEQGGSIWDVSPWCNLLIYFLATLSICWWLGVLGRRWTTWLFWPSRLGGRLGSGVLGCFFARTRGEASEPGGRPCAGLWWSGDQRNRGCELTFSCLLFLLGKRFCLGLFSL